MNEQTASEHGAAQTSSDRVEKLEVAWAGRAAEAWLLLRVWHLEAMECVIELPTVVHFVRTSYVSVPPRWRELPMMELARRVELLLHAHYRIRAATLWTPEVDERMQPFAFDFEWVTREDTPVRPGAEVAPWLLPVARANPRLAEIAFAELSARQQAPRPGIAARCYDDAFEVVRVDADDTWHIIDRRDRASMFAARHEGR